MHWPESFVSKGHVWQFDYQIQTKVTESSYLHVEARTVKRATWLFLGDQSSGRTCIQSTKLAESRHLQVEARTVKRATWLSVSR